MDITPLAPKDRLIIQRYGNGGFVINDRAYSGNILITISGVIALPISDMEALKEQDLAQAFTNPLPEIMLIGMGAIFKPLSAHLRAALKAKNIATDAMDTGAACRTYNVLVTEGRLAAAALIAV